MSEASRGAIARATLVVIAVTIVCGLHTLVWPFGRDQGIEGTTGWMLLQGQAPYREAWSNSPPGGFLCWALGFATFGINPVAVRLVDMMFIAGSAAGLCLLAARRLTPAMGIVAGSMLAISYYLHGNFSHTAQRDSLMILPGVWAVLVAHTATRRAAIVAGLLVGMAALFKPGGAVLGLPVAVALGAKPRRWVEAGAAALIPPLLFLIWLFASGAWPGFVEAVLDFNRGYAKNYAAGSDGRLLAATVSLLRLPFLERPELAVGVLGLFARHPLRRLALAWLLAGASNVYAQAALYSYHYLPLLPALALSTALALHVVPSMLARPRATKLGLSGLLVGGVLVGVPQWSRNLRVSWSIQSGGIGDGEYNSVFDGARELEVVANEIRKSSAEGETLFVWGADAQLYVLSQRAPGHRYAVNFPVVAPWSGVDRPRLVEDLAAEPPRHVVIRRKDFIPWLNGFRGDSAASLQAFPKLLGFLQQNYLQVASTNYLLLLRRAPTNGINNRKPSTPTRSKKTLGAPSSDSL